MSVLFLLLLAVLAGVLRARGLRRTARVIFVLDGVLFFAIGCGPVPDVLLKDLQLGSTPEPMQAWQPRTAIIILGGGVQTVANTGSLEVPLHSNGRVFKGLELYSQCKRAGKTCVLITSGGDAAEVGVSEAKVYGDALLRAGVDPADLVMEGRSLNTWQNAQFCGDWLASHPQDEVVLVTSGFHLARARLYFSHFGIRVQPVRSDYVAGRLGVVPQAYNFLLLDLAAHEYGGLWRYRIYEIFGWNIRARSAGSL